MRRNLPRALILLAALASASCARASYVAQAPATAPSSAASPYVLSTDVAGIAARLRPIGRDTIVGAAGGLQSVAYVRSERGVLNQGESHDAGDDYHVVLEGTAAITLGGRLDGPTQVSPGEWRAPRIVGGTVVQVKKGDVLYVPRGMPHQIDDRAGDYSFMVIKVYSEPLPAKAR
jgi:mannose-6-phosphate isomerase-like protein (cupin superfamily)